LGNIGKKTRTPLGLAVLLASFGAMSASADTVYNDIPTAVNGSVASPQDYSSSVPFAEDEVSQFGGLISMSNGAGTINNGWVGLTDWGTAAEYASYIAANPSAAGCTTGVGGTCTGANANGFYTNVTVNLYNPGASSVDPATGDTVYAVGSQFATVTTDAFIAWSTASQAGEPICTDGLGAFANGGGNQCGTPVLVPFALSASVPATFIYGVSFATDQLSDMPSDSLNLGLNPFAPSEGSNPQPDTAYYSVTNCNTLLSPSLPCTAGVFEADTGWGNYGEAAIDFAPEPATFGLIGFGLVGLGIVARKKKNNTRSNS